MRLNGPFPCPRRRSVRSARGSVLALVPAGFLVLILLAALAVDNAVTYMGQRQLHDALSAAANDAVSAGLNDASFYRSGTLVLDPGAAARTVCAAVGSQGDPSLHGVSLAMAIAGHSILLTGSATVDAVFGRAVPGFARRAVSARAEATLAAGPNLSGPVSFGPPVPLQCG